MAQSHAPLTVSYTHRHPYRPGRRRWVPKGVMLLGVLFVVGLLTACQSPGAWPSVSARVSASASASVLNTALLSSPATAIAVPAVATPDPMTAMSAEEYRARQYTDLSADLELRSARMSMF